MTCLQRLKKLHLFNRSSYSSSKSNLCSSGPPPIVQLLRFCATESAVDFSGGNICGKRYIEVRREAQDTLLDYFHQTRNLPFIYAESLSRNSPQFLGRLLNIALINGDGGDVGRSLTRFLRYHPVNEFEPFFESIGLGPCDYASFLPRDSIFLSDDELLLENYHVLWYYGVRHDRIGKIFMEAKEVFSYGHGILQSRLQSFHYWGLPQSLVVEMIATSPHLLKSGDNQELHDFLNMLNNLGIDLHWLEKHIKGVDSCDWKCMIEVMCLLGDLGFTKKQSREVIMNHPHLLLERSGSCTLCLFSLFLKFGLTKSDVQALFHHFPKVSVASFIRNLLQSYQFLVGINMPAHDIAKMVCLHPLLLGACQLRKVSNLLRLLNCGVNRIRKMVEADPYLLKKWVRGVRVDRLPEPSRTIRVRRMKTAFLERLGSAEKSVEMEKLLKRLNGNGEELQERFDCLVKSGLSRENVAAMVKSYPKCLSLSKDAIERKIDVLVRDLGYPVSVVFANPIILTYTIERLKLRLLMYKWLRDEGAVKKELSLTTLLSFSDERFLTVYVNSHPKGTRVWERMKEEINILSSFLLRDSIFLSGDELLLENYHVLWYYGVGHDRIGKIYMEAKEVFSYGHGILQSRLQSFHNWGLPQSLVVEMIATSPHLLKSGDNQELHDFLNMLKNLGIDLDWLGKHIKGADSCDWKCMIEVMCLLGDLGFTKKQSREVIMNHPHLLLERSGSCTFCLFSLLLKFGLTQSGIREIFYQFPQISVASFMRNILQSYHFLVELKMPSHDIAKMVCLHPLLLGVCQLKRVSSLIRLLNCGVNRIRKMVEADPSLLKKWVIGVRVDRLPEPSRTIRVRRMKTVFLERLGFAEKSGGSEKLLKLLNGKGEELQERFDCLVKSGLSQENVAAMVKSNPRFLELSKDAIERKIDVLVRDLGYPVNVVFANPMLLTYTIERLKLRLLMYKWLRDEGAMKKEVSLMTLLKCSDERFLRIYVNSHRKGTQVWERMKEEMNISS